MDNFTASVSNEISAQVRAEFDGKLQASNAVIEAKFTATNAAIDGKINGSTNSLPAFARTGNMDAATNMIHYSVINVSGDYAVSAADTNAMRTTNLLYVVNTSASNIAFTFPDYFINTFTVLNLGSNWAVLTAPAGKTFLTYPTSGALTYSSTLNNKYLGKSQTFLMVNQTNFAVVSDFRPLTNIIDDVVQNVAIPTTNTLLPSALAASTYQPILTYQPATNGAAITEAQVTGLVSDLASKVGASVTNGLATQTYVTSQGYVAQSVTNGLLASSVAATTYAPIAVVSYSSNKVALAASGWTNTFTVNAQVNFTNLTGVLADSSGSNIIATIGAGTTTRCLTMCPNWRLTGTGFTGFAIKLQ